MERDPITMAKEIASVDQLSNGRLLFGIGGGWNVEEMANHGTPFKKRWKVLRENIEAMKEIWTKEAAEYHGEFVDFDPIWSYPKPAQDPHPPIILGTHTSAGLDRVVRYCDGWLPNARRYKDLPGILGDLRQRAQQAGRKPETIAISVLGAANEEDTLKGYQDLGVERAIFFVLSAEQDKLLPILDEHAALISKVA